MADRALHDERSASLLQTAQGTPHLVRLPSLASAREPLRERAHDGVPRHAGTPAPTRAWAFGAPRELPGLLLTGAMSERALPLAALLGLLQRACRARQFAIDLTVHVASLPLATCGCVDFALPAEAPLASLLPVAEAALRTLPSITAHRETRRSNVALTLLRGAFEADPMGLAAAHDLHVVVYEHEQRVSLRLAHDARRIAAARVEQWSDALVATVGGEPRPLYLGLYA
jgi:hypothetical protein